jgi:hypothetical protein
MTQSILFVEFIEVKSINAGSQAAKFGVQVGDQIDTINGEVPGHFLNTIDHHACMPIYLQHHRASDGHMPLPTLSGAFSTKRKRPHWTS